MEHPFLLWVLQQYVGRSGKCVTMFVLKEGNLVIPLQFFVMPLIKYWAGLQKELDKEALIQGAEAMLTLRFGCLQGSIKTLQRKPGFKMYHKMIMKPKSVQLCSETCARPRSFCLDILAPIGSFVCLLGLRPPAFHYAFLNYLLLPEQSSGC